MVSASVIFSDPRGWLPPRSRMDLLHCFKTGFEELFPGRIRDTVTHLLWWSLFAVGHLVSEYDKPKVMQLRAKVSFSAL